MPLQPSFRKTGASYNMKSSYGLRCSLSSSLIPCGIYCIWWQSLHGIHSAGWRRDAEVSHLASPYGASYWLWKSIQPLNCARSAKSKRNKHIHQPTWREKRMRKREADVADGYVKRDEASQTAVLSWLPTVWQSLDWMGKNLAKLHEWCHKCHWVWDFIDSWIWTFSMPKNENYVIIFYFMTL